MLGLFFLSLATLLYEINLARLFSVAQFYHFAFMIISLAMLGFGASGTALALFPHFGRRHPQRTLALLAVGYGATCVGAYVLTNLLPFDSFSIALDRRQVLILALHYLALAAPFLCSGGALGLLFVHHPREVGRLYATNLGGSAAGCLLALVTPGWLGAEGTVLVSGALGAASALLFTCRWAGTKGTVRWLRGAAVLFLLTCLGGLIRLPGWMEVRLSPYKGLSYALQYPDAHVAFRRWNSFSRIDLVESRGIRSLPGLSYRYLKPPPAQQGLFIDGDDQNAVIDLDPEVLERHTDQTPSALAFSDYMPTAIAYRLRPGGRALVLEPRGGSEIWVALAQGAAEVTAVESNPLVVAAAGDIYQHPRVAAVLEDPRSFVRRTAASYDVVALPLTTPYHPIRSGAYSLAEDYHYTVEALRDDLACLKPGGILVLTRWLQMPPSESLRAFALAVTALEEAGGDPVRQIVAFRGYAAMTILVKIDAFAAAELEAIRQFAADRAFDLVYAPDIRPEEVNRYNVLAEPIYYQAFLGLLQAPDRTAWYASYSLDVRPPTDDHPFFGHFFRWSQAGQVIAELGKTWQPFGGAGYFVLLLLLALALAAALLIILLPLIVVRRPGRNERPLPASRAAKRTPSRLGTLAYFGLLGLGFLLVEVPLIQRFILFLGHPAHALTTVLFALLLFSGVGSMLSHRLPLRTALGLVVLLVLGYPLLLPPLFAWALPLPLMGRIAVSVLALAPAGLLMGMPFPQGMRRLEAGAPERIPWAWGINGATSVVASVGAALLALSFGFTWVLMAGALCYAGAWAAAGQGRRPGM